MLKTYPTTFLLPKRLKLALVDNLGPTSQTPSSKMTTDASGTQRNDPQPILLAPHRTPSPSPSQVAAAAAAQASASEPAQPQRRPMTWFPLGYKEAATQWWSSGSGRQTERNVLSFVPYLREAGSTTDVSQLQELAKNDPFGHRIWRSSMVELPGKNRALNEFSIERVGEEADDTLVMLHGYGAGLGFFFKNFEPLSRAKGWRLYALDMLGMGNSSRPPFKIYSKEPQDKIREAESWFIDALEDWRKARKLEKFTLLGHSMGGYLAVSYALKYPGRLNKLILASPVGIPEDPWAVNADMPEPEESTFANEFTQDQESIVHGQPAGGNAGYVNAKDKKAAAQSSTTANTPPKRPIPGWLTWLWDANVSPFSIIRLAGPLGPRFVSGWTSRRFNHLPPEEKEALHMYSYSLFRQKGSGEYALPYLLAPGAYARSPMINRIQEVGRQVIKHAAPQTTAHGAPAVEVKEHGYPIIFMYGENDWMDVAGGYAAEEKLKKRILQSLLHGTEEEKRKENGSAKVVVVRNAGHHLYLDNPEEFNEVIRKEMEETRAQTQRQKAML